MAAQAQSYSSLAEERLYRIGEVCRLTDTKAFVLRYWETEFPMLQPVKSPKGHRLYRRQDIETVLAIKRLLYEEGFTIAGARRHLAEGQPQPAAPATVGSGSPAPAAGDRRVLLELRDELREILTLLETR
jgi:DNA-binding transcriptional MerR regulator